MISDDLDKVESLNEYLWSILGRKLGDVFIWYKDGKLMSIPAMISEDVKQQLLTLAIFKIKKHV